MVGQRTISEIMGFWKMNDKKETKRDDKNPPKNIQDKQENTHDKKTEPRDDKVTDIDVEKCLTVDKNTDKVYARREIDKTRKLEFKKRIAEMKLRTKDSPQRTMRVPDKKTPLTNDKNTPHYPDKNQSDDKKKIPQVDLAKNLTKKRKFEDRKDSSPQPDKKIAAVSKVSYDKKKGEDKKVSRAQKIEKGIQEKITMHFSNISNSRNSREDSEVPGPQPEGLPGGGGQLGHTPQSPLHRWVGARAILASNAARNVIGGGFGGEPVGTNHRQATTQQGNLQGGQRRFFGPDQQH